MNQINRLIQKAAAAVRDKAERLTLALVEPVDIGVYQVDCHLWNGKEGSGVRRLITRHDSMEAAMIHIEAVAAEYPNRYEDIPIIYDDILE